MAVSHAACSPPPSRHARRCRHRRGRRTAGHRRGRLGWFVVAALASGLLAGAAWAAGSSTDPVKGDAHRVLADGDVNRGEPGQPLLDGGGTVRNESDRPAAVGLTQAPPAADVGPSVETEVTDGSGAGGYAAAATRRAVRVLRGWDRARAAAYAAGSVRSLRELYDDGAGEADVRLLRSYLRRGYRVEHLRMQLLAVRVLRHRPGVWSVRVTDRLAGAVAVGYGERLDLPRDRAGTRTVVLRRDRTGGWRVARVSG